jgi:precorrin-4/cobalt-precorrin-4 C11-methyltransferase
MAEAVRGGGRVARVHTGDPGLYGAVREQMELLERDGIPHETIPGVTASFAAAALASRSFTVPGITQTLIITRLAGRTPVPEREALAGLAAHGAAMAVYLSAGDPEGVQTALLEGGMAPETLVALGYRVGWPDQRMAECALGQLAATAREQGFTRQTVFLVLPGQGGGEDGQAAETARSLLYDKTFSHGFRAAEEEFSDADD